MKNKELASFLSFSLAAAAWLWYENDFLQISKYEYISSKISSKLDGFTVVHISDLHGKSIGKDHFVTISAIKKLSPDIIVITGDIMDRRRRNLASAVSFAGKVAKIAPVYFVAGNHEANSGEYISSVLPALEHAGVNVMRDEAVRIKRGDDAVNLIGLECVGFLPGGYRGKCDLGKITRLIDKLSEANCLNVVLSHRPELMEQYSLSCADVVFCGHAHGGQFVVPFADRGVLSPDQGFWPRYFKGVYQNNNTSMFVSRGIGNSVFPFRINNRPEILAVKFKTLA